MVTINLARIYWVLFPFYLGAAAVMGAMPEAELPIAMGAYVALATALTGLSLAVSLFDIPHFLAFCGTHRPRMTAVSLLLCALIAFAPAVATIWLASEFPMPSVLGVLLIFGSWLVGLVAFGLRLAERLWRDNRAEALVPDVDKVDPRISLAWRIVFWHVVAVLAVNAGLTPVVNYLTRPDVVGEVPEELIAGGLSLILFMLHAIFPAILAFVFRQSYVRPGDVADVFD